MDYITISQDNVRKVQEEAVEVINEAEKNQTPPDSSEKADSETLIKMKKLDYAHPLITRYLGTGDTLVVSFMGLLGLLLIVLDCITFFFDIERTKAITPCITAVLGYLAGKRFKP